ncbi:hypothetical protein H7E67_02290 [Clostridium gasigenes]|uniref:hypothetical protein n=1 Tax=Clostridium gasigenes TaxID=94869 RepID=UPI00162A2F0D|nr:hypothetical protein [Clostridium gasigenes]MBB6622249.1 hypothetical protein [Clostridium gasigenes]
MLYNYFYKYDFDNFEEPYRFKINIKNGSKFKFLNNYYEYYFYPREKEQLLCCYSFSEMDKEGAERQIQFSNNVLQFIFIAPICDKNVYIQELDKNKDITVDYVNISTKKIDILRYISDKILKFKVERELFEEVIGLHGVALSCLINNNYEDSVLYHFKIIEKLSKKNYIKFHEKNYTKKVKQTNKNKIRSFIEEYFTKNLKVRMTENMLSTATDEIYKKLRKEAYSSIFLKISFLCNCKNLLIDSDKVNELVKTRNKLAHGDSVEEYVVHNSLRTAILLSQESISLYFFHKKYKDIHISTDIFYD